ncbi:MULTISPECIES: serine hydrolase [unclassified Leptolyngbya]|uniref:serine hydrolase n=1 Tax=unclassified Leptolyngbya TaxID=2650499 RepID=UPI001684129F|nr:MULTISPECIES: serine hydrolase [unclassified Leptolyngbya]MBD1912197.1 serine hydrolase [Leptolyngbya sp. FACHB-8]MBD2155088.1 serine hydrolase [Leptolyngbya sp. FACHB-16]
MRHLWWYLTVTPLATFGIWATSLIVPSFPVLAPVLETPHSKTVPFPEAKSLQELYQIRDRLQADLAKRQPVLISSQTGTATAPTELLDSLQAVEIHIQVEESAKQSWNDAIRFANQATALKSQADDSEESAKQAYTLWKQAMDSLKEVSKDSFMAAQAEAKRKEYENNYAVAAYRYDTVRSGFLKAIAEKTGMASRVRVTVCNMQRECRRLRGNEPPASPASLIKVPVAVALMAKLDEEKINPETKIMVSRGNWTEDAGKIWVGSEYSLKKIMLDMISYSGNIATNQLIDYVGRDYINQVLRDRGYTTTTVRTKLVGQSTYPANLGTPPNVMTTDELTDMMVGIYNQEHPGDDLILEGLVNQYDWELGYEAVKRPAVWIGEKTGQNSKVLGSTTGVNIQGERYVITVTIDYTASEPAVKTVIQGVVEYLVKNNGFGGNTAAPPAEG